MQLECEPVQNLASKPSPGELFKATDGDERLRSDEELVVAAQQGDSSALGELLGRHQKKIHNVARHYTANADEAHDLVQEAMLRACGNIGRFRREARFSSWLTSIVINAAISEKRREKRVTWIHLDEQDKVETRFCMKILCDVRRNPEEEYSHGELRGLLRRETLNLPTKDRLILKACDLDESSIEEAARVLEIHVGTAKSRLHRARHRLFAAMNKSGVGCNQSPRRTASSLS